jgi:hypothetical protein
MIWKCPCFIHEATASTARFNLKLLAALIILTLFAQVRLNAQSLLLDDFTTGNASRTGPGRTEYVTTNTFGGHRDIVLNPLSGNASVVIGSGSLTWNQAVSGDYLVIYNSSGSASAQDYDISAYDAFQFTVASAPPNAGQLQVEVGFRLTQFSSTTVDVTVNVPTNGIVTVPFSAFITASGSSVSFSHVLTVGFKMGGYILSPGVYVFKNFKAIVSVPTQLANPTFKLGGTFAFDLQGAPGSNYVVEASADLKAWSPIATNTMPAEGTMSLEDSPAAATEARFYRAIRQR